MEIQIQDIWRSACILSAPENALSIYMLLGHYMSHIICLIYFVIILDVDKAPTNAVGLHYHGNHYLQHFIQFHISAIVTN